MLSVGGAIWLSNESTVNMASRRPAARNMCPSAELVELTATKLLMPKRLLTAAISHRSPVGVGIA